MKNPRLYNTIVFGNLHQVAGLRSQKVKLLRKARSCLPPYVSSQNLERRYEMDILWGCDPGLSEGSWWGTYPTKRDCVPATLTCI